MNFNNRKFTLFVRTISGIVLGLIAIDIIFFNHKYICQNRFTGLIAGIAGVLVQYKVDYAKKSFKERLLIIISILIIASILYFFWYK
ncbi:hypothetical protein SAMN05444401_1830 [Clostridium amylolyticum]|uniref:Uncharacterized protein n=1 Tax=Clostridium amylolyticum TaxID=1121298 RepID=A0A1M6F798_9CLOT|nr:hypothetical protein [Clostridium amylolyticum]SHI93532.1 hypothetical protein SAMN05444401_1830 [Clostridium amylolyticum]